MMVLQQSRTLSEDNMEQSPLQPKMDRSCKQGTLLCDFKSGRSQGCWLEVVLVRMYITQPDQKNMTRETE